ncbi:MAG TPA: hypothetical protein VM778_10205 [Gemmatimonadota bacterium]|nr:hypothetical protein [Gemmatimonadota bacterium]
MSRAADPRLAAVGIALLLGAGCSEQDRKAWVSILPGSDPPAASDADTVPAPPGFSISDDSTAVRLDGQAVVTIERLPDRGPGDTDLREARFGTAAISPDSLHVGFATAGETPVVGVWNRARQSARLVTALPGAAIGRLEWSPDGRFAIWQATGPDGVTTVGAYDLRIGRAARHPVLSWLERRDRSVRIQDWMTETRLRLLVSAGREPDGGLAWMWELHGGSLVVEDQVEALARGAPPGSQLLAGGAFSANLLGDPVPESIALYVSGSSEPSALVVRNRAGEYAATATEPLIAPGVLGLESWKGIRRGPELSEIVDVGDRPILLISIPVPENPVQTLGFFRVAPDGRVEPVVAVGAGGAEPALFPDGRTPDRIFDLGLVDLDGDGQVEVAAAVGRQDPNALTPRLQWGVQVWKWDDGPRLVPAPELERPALERIEGLSVTDGGS